MQGDRVAIPAQLTLIDAEAAELLASLLVPPSPGRHGVEVAPAVQLAQRILELIARLNSREALIAALLVALASTDDFSLERGLEIERVMLQLHGVIARTRCEPEPKFPQWLQIAQQLLAQDKEAEEAAANAALRGQREKSVRVAENANILSCTQAGRPSAGTG